MTDPSDIDRRRGEQSPSDEELELDRQRSEIAEWQRVTGFGDPDALGSYLSRQTVLECDAALGRVLAAAQDGQRAALAEVDQLRRELHETLVALRSAKDALEVATTPLPEDRQAVLAAFRAIEALKR